MQYYKMLMDGHLAAVVSENEILGKREELEAGGWEFELTKYVAPPSSPMIEFTCGHCEYKMWISDDDEDEIEVECDICEVKYELTRAHQGAWHVKQVVAPEGQITLTDEEV